MDTSGFFETFFNNARYNGIVILETDGTILNVNEGFHLRFGYVTEDLQGKNFELLFIEEDKKIDKPKHELQEVLSKGSANDENYIKHKDGSKLWVTGESVLINNKDGDAFIIKVIHNIHAQKQLERFLLQSHEFIDTVFDSIDVSALLLLDGRLRIIKVNKAFTTMFELSKPIKEGSRLSELDSSFWQRPDVKQEVVNYLVMHNIGETRIFDLQSKSGETNKISFSGKLIDGVPNAERKLLIMIKYPA
jgi:PAS domain S-box-containing protein